MNEQTLIFSNNFSQELAETIQRANPASVFILTDKNTSQLVLPRLLSDCPELKKAIEITIPAGDEAKNLDSLAAIWASLVDGGATRKSLLINVGGGVVTDIGGFAAATFKRGIRFINIPTTLLAAVDAAVGGKTGINFHGLKNEIGAFRNAEAVIISTRFFDTLTAEELLSGFAEMIKHSLLSGPTAFKKIMGFDITSPNLDLLLPLVEESVRVKEAIVKADPTERGLRKALNLGHTPAHAFESLAFSKDASVPHGFAVAWGLVIDLILSRQRLGFPSTALYSVVDFVKSHYGTPAISCDDYPAIIDFMKHDKKNVVPGRISFTLLKEPGAVELGETVMPDEIPVILDIFRDLIQ
ncbi:MAG: 3-dehydroquinate synthase [Paramuribaculum sp.]|nr:3-dehydroquinate synthase [Paramuribaculum sp.]